MAQKEVYRLDIKVGVSGDSESKSKLTAVEKMTQQIEKKTKALNKLSSSPSVKIKDNASNTLTKIKSKASDLNNTKLNPSVRITDNASNRISEISSKLKRLESSNVTVTLRVNDQNSKYLNEVHGQNDKLKNTSVNPTAEVSDSNLDFSKIGSKISSVGNTLNTRLTLPILGFGVAANKIGMDFDSQMSRVKAISGATGHEFEKLHDQALQLGADTAFSAKQAAEGMENLASAGFSTSEIMNAMPGLLDLAASSGESLASSSDIAASTLRGFGLAASDAGHVADVLAKNASATNAAVVDTGEAMKYISPVAQTAGWSLESVAASIGELANSGIKGSQAGTTLRAMFSRLAKPSDESAKAMEKMGFKAYDAQHKMKSLSQIISDLSNSTAKMTDEQKQNTIAQVFGEEAMSGILTLIKNGSGSLDALTNSYINSNGAAKEMAKTMQDNAKSAIEQMTGSLETAGIKIEEAFAPKITEAANYVQDLANKFSELSPQQQDFYVKMALGVAAIGPLTKLIGGVTSAIGGLISVGSKASVILPALFTPAGLAIAGTVALIGTAAVTESNLMKKSITTTTEELGPLERVLNSLNGNVYKSKKEMIEAGLIYDDFGEGVSDSFKKTAQDSSKSLLKLEMNINRLTTDDKFDDAENNQLKNWANDMAYEGINAIKSKQSEIKSELSKTFSLDGVTSASEQGTLDYMDKFFGEGVNKELEIRDEMYAIGDKAIKDHGKLLDDDIKQLRDKAAQLQEIKLEYANAENAGEQAYAQSKFQSKAERVTGIDGVTELLQERAKERQDAIDETKAKYDKTIETAKYHLYNDKNLTDTDKTNFQNVITENEKARDEALNKAKDGFQSDLETIYKAYPQAKGAFNEKTGEKFSGEDITAHKGTDYLKNHFDNLNQITQEGWYRIKNTTSGEMEDIYATVDKDTGEINGAWSKTAGWSGGYTDELKQKVKELGQAHETERANIQNSLIALTGSTLDSNNQVISSTNTVIGQLQGVQSATGGAITGIININGTPMQITSNASGQITSMEEYKGAIDAIPPSADVHINSNAGEVTGEVSGLITKANEADGKTITITTIFKKITDWFDGKFDNATKIINDNSTAAAYKENYTGTDNATPGLNSVAERGMELVLGRKFYNFKGGEKVLNNKQTVDLLKSANSTNNEPFQVKQGQYQLVQPQQFQLAGIGGNNVQVDVQVNSGQDVEGIIVEVTQEVGRKLREALTNTKK